MRRVGESVRAQTQPFSWFEKAATSGFPRAQSDLAGCYEFGIGTACDTDLSFYWYLKAANQGFADAQLCAAWALSKGQGVEVNLEEAFVWFERSLLSKATIGLSMSWLVVVATDWAPI